MRDNRWGVMGAILVFAAPALMGASPGPPQQEKPDDPLERVGFLVGDWAGTLELVVPGGRANAEATGHAARIYGSNYIKTEYVYDVPGPLVIEGTEYLTYDSGRKKYRSWAFQNSGRQPYVSEGELVDGALVMTTLPDGQPNHVPMRATMRPGADNSVSYRMERKQGDGWALIGEGTFKKDPPGFTTIFDGKTLNGWHVSAQTGHSAASGNKTGGAWVVKDGAITGTQDVAGNGGIVLTDKQYGDFEVILEMKNDFGPDSGLFLRSNEKGQAYQALIDYHEGGNLMGIYGEGLTGELHVRNFNFIGTPDKISPVENSFTPLPVKPGDWPMFWKHGQWNELRARIEQNPPRITTWINGVKFMEWADKEKRHPDRGSIALQVHGGGDMRGQFVRYRRIRVKEL